MTLAQLFFLLVALMMLFSALKVVTTRNLIHAALWLVVTLFGVAVLFAMLDAGFLAVVQVMVYIGAIAILFIFAVMLTRREMNEKTAPLNPNWPVSALIALAVFGGLIWLLRGWQELPQGAAALPAGTDALRALGEALVSPQAFALPFEVASVLLVAALIGAVYVAYGRK
uniref:NADH-quinone oxidoreductase subunit J n=1 Tax=uncultured Chloroflexota bacterium TaxID=166587 RepID=H5SA70_9CHLR|nr:NADH dehydrogenase I subunit J [uncultured Chloroflexota bacterium]